MESQEIEKLLQDAFQESEVTVQGMDGKYQVNIRSDAFAGLNQVKRQQAVYKVLNPHIASGAIHAVSMNLSTSEGS